MEHIYFEAQLFIKISNFIEISNIDILINLCLATSLHLDVFLAAVVLHSHSCNSSQSLSGGITKEYCCHMCKLFDAV